MLHNLFHVGGYKNIVNAATSEQIDHKEGIDNESGQTGPLVQRWRPCEEGGLGYIGKPKRRHLSPTAQNVGALHQNVHTIGANRADQECWNQTEPQAAIGEGERHRQDARPKRPFQQMDQGFPIAAMKRELFNKCKTEKHAWGGLRRGMRDLPMFEGIVV